MIQRSDSIQLSSPLGGQHIIGAEANIQKVRTCLRRKIKVSARRLSIELGISATNVRRIKNDLGLKPGLPTVPQNGVQYPISLLRTQENFLPLGYRFCIPFRL